MKDDLGYSSAGPPHAPALLLIHPLGADRHFWASCVALWRETYFCVSCDLRSAGTSPRATAPVNLAQHVADLERLRWRLGLARVIPVGCAVGAMVACSYAASHPDRVEALVMINPGIRITDEGGAALRQRAEEVRRGGMGAIMPAVVDNAFHGLPRDARYRAFAKRFASQEATAYALSALGFADADVTEDARRVICPTLLLLGAHDTLLPSWHAEKLNATIASSELQTIEDAAHFAPYQRPAKVASLVSAFLSSTGRPRLCAS